MHETLGFFGFVMTSLNSELLDKSLLDNTHFDNHLTSEGAISLTYDSEVDAIKM